MLAESPDITYLRLSVTDRCNLRCIYCMPKRGVKLIPRSEILNFEELIQIVEVATSLGVKKLKITGGEPLLRHSLAILIRKIKENTPIQDLSLTTNGILLGKFAKDLKDAGLSRVNISLDTLKQEKFTRITREENASIYKVLEGIEVAERCGLKPIKINVVNMRGINDDEICAFVRFAIDRSYEVRFIELMPAGKKRLWNDRNPLLNDEVKMVIEKHFGRLIPKSPRGVSIDFGLERKDTTIGFISPISKPFCSSCNKLRITSSGELKTCLFASSSIGLKQIIRGRIPQCDEHSFLTLAKTEDKKHLVLRSVFKKAISIKENLKQRETRLPSILNMSRIGG